MERHEARVTADSGVPHTNTLIACAIPTVTPADPQRHQLRIDGLDSALI